MLAIRGLLKDFGGFVAIRDVDFDLAAGRTPASPPSSMCWKVAIRSGPCASNSSVASISSIFWL